MIRVCGSTERTGLVPRTIIILAVCAVGFMSAVKDGRMLKGTGITASCSIVQTASDGSELAACRPGKLEGLPDLTRRGCTNAGVTGTNQYWRCPATAGVR
jgi:hypothetical protein